MPHRSHLPLAVTYATARDLETATSEQLVGMLKECDRWFADLRAFRDAICSDAGRTEFSILTREDIAEATAARSRVQGDIDRRHESLPDQSG